MAPVAGASGLTGAPIEDGATAIRRALRRLDERGWLLDPHEGRAPRRADDLPCDCPPGVAGPGDETHQWTKTLHGRRADDVQSRHARFEAPVQDRVARIV